MRTLQYGPTVQQGVAAGRMKVQLLTNPASDHAFRVAAERLLDHLPFSPERLQSDLVRDYPRASVVRGIQDRGTERWYAYRDGHWVDPATD